MNEEVFNKVVDVTSKICDILDIEDFMFSSFSEI